MAASHRLKDTIQEKTVFASPNPQTSYFSSLRSAFPLSGFQHWNQDWRLHVCIPKLNTYHNTMQCLFFCDKVIAQEPLCEIIYVGGNLADHNWSISSSSLFGLRKESGIVRVRFISTTESSRQNLSRFNGTWLSPDTGKWPTLGAKHTLSFTYIGTR